MQFQLDITLTEMDYLAFNHFHSLESPQAKKQICKSRIVFTAIVVALMMFVILYRGFTVFSAVFVALIGVFALLYMLFFKKIIKANINAQVKRLKSVGKLPFDPISRMEFYNDKIVEVSASKRIEQSYAALERICVVMDQYIYLYNSSATAYILPLPQLRSQLNQEEFLSFLSRKCGHSIVT